MLISTFTLFWQLLILFVCCSGVGLFSRLLLPKEFPLLKTFLFCLLGGFCLVVLIPQNLVYLEVPVRISAWLVLAGALVQVWFFRHQLVGWGEAFYSNAEIRTLALVILLTAIFHGFVPVQQGLERYYGKGFPDQLNYAVLAEFLKEEPYSTSEKEIGLRPWLARVVGTQQIADQAANSFVTNLAMNGIKKERIGQSIVTAEISAWSGTDGEGGYAATVIFFLLLLAICLYVFLRDTGLNRFMAGSGALLGALLPSVTRLSLDGFLSQVSILFIFPFFASLLRHQDLRALSFTLFASLTLTYLFAAYSEIAPIGLGTIFLGVIFVRKDNGRSKRIMLMGTLLLIALLNPYYLHNLIEFLSQQYYMAANATFLAHMAPNVVTLGGWSELIFGVITSPVLTTLFDCCTLLLGILFFAGLLVTFLSKDERSVFGAILLPIILAILYLATRTAHSSYAIAKIILTILPFAIGLVLVGLSKAATNNQHRPPEVLKKLFVSFIVTAAAAGSVRYYTEVLDNVDMLRYVREPRFLNVCRELEKIKNMRVLVFETHPWLSMWLCYHARHNAVYFSGGLMDNSPVPLPRPFSNVPDLKDVDLVVTRDRIVDLSAPSTSCLTLVNDIPGEDRTDGRTRYLLGPPAGLRFLALRPISGYLRMRLEPGPEATTLPIDYFLGDHQGYIAQGEIRADTVEARRMNFPRGLSGLQLSVKSPGPSFPILAELDELEVSELDPKPGG